jgi:hypothetical protein
VKASTAILLALLGVGVYLLYRSLQNIQSSIGQVGTNLNGMLSVTGTALSNLYAEGKAGASSLLSPLSSLASLGTTAGNGLASFFGNGQSTTLDSSLGTNSLYMPDNTALGNLGGDTVAMGAGGLSNSLIPVDGGMLNLHLGGGMTAANSDGSYGSILDGFPGGASDEQYADDTSYLSDLMGDF